MSVCAIETRRHCSRGAAQCRRYLVIGEPAPIPHRDRKAQRWREAGHSRTHTVLSLCIEQVGDAIRVGTKRSTKSPAIGMNRRSRRW